MSKITPTVACPFCLAPTPEVARAEGQPVCPKCGALFEFGRLPAEARAALAVRLDVKPKAVSIGVCVLPDDTQVVAGWETEEALTIPQVTEIVRLARQDVVRRVLRGDFPGAVKVDEGGRKGKLAPWRVPRSAILAWRNAPRKPRGGGSYPATSRKDGRLKKNRPSND